MAPRRGHSGGLPCPPAGCPPGNNQTLLGLALHLKRRRQLFRQSQHGLGVPNIHGDEVHGHGIVLRDGLCQRLQPLPPARYQHKLTALRRKAPRARLAYAGRRACKRGGGGGGQDGEATGGGHGRSQARLLLVRLPCPLLSASPVIKTTCPAML